ncbi:MAG: hypothetical protein KatS3mg035_0623 [Bacteroidia bacterium]|nr:MAG: hypothetical protein KatS3mg035_0623 [Bacteroidia bacterium]
MLPSKVPIGNIITDINMKIGKRDITYSGNLQTYSLNLDKIFEFQDTILPSLNFMAKVQGKNFDIATMDTRAEFFIDHSPIFKNLVDSLSGNLVLNQKILKGHLNLMDKDASAIVDIAFDFNAQPIYNLSGDLKKIRLKKFSGYRRTLCPF